VLNGAPQFVGRPEGEPQWQADVCQVWQSRNSGIFCLPGFVEDRGQICFSRHADSSVRAKLIFPDARPKRGRARKREAARSSAFFTDEISPKIEMKN